jgi:hypothetical protein
MISLPKKSNNYVLNFIKKLLPFNKYETNNFSSKINSHHDTQKITPLQISNDRIIINTPIDDIETSPKINISDINKDKTNEDTIDSFIIIDYNQKIDMAKAIETINSYISQTVLEKISKLQEKAYRIDKSGIDIVECCVCLEEGIKIMPLECTHTLCIDCYKKLVENQYIICPLCRKEMRCVTIHKFYAIMTPFEYFGIGIMYLPPIYTDEEKKWIDYEVFFDINSNAEQSFNFISACKRINFENYVVVFCNENLSKIIKTLSSEDIQKINTIKIDIF